ncbi:MAG: NAD-dependent succinate-semialdehyde dehydrogenase [Desulfovibrio sp.]|nr:NAD-dependent succinate-semialdehyde dehydrogenase [Desulfovibrio sp.]
MHRILQDKSLFRPHCLIDGQWCDAADKSVLDVINPSNGTQLGQVPNCGVEDAKRAVEAAHTAFAAWRAKSPLERGVYLHAWEQAIHANIEDLARLLTLEQGKPLAEAKAEILQGASYFPWYAEEARRVSGEVVPEFRHGVQALTRHEPLGVACAITPWNFPMSMIPRKVAPALAAGCTAIVKPASAPPYSALALAELAMRVGIPAGVFNVITGSAGAIGSVITESPLVRKLSFTGSTPVGRTLAAQCGPSLKRVSLELGGNAPFIVFDDADMDMAARMALGNKFRNAGQTCICANRFLVHKDVFDAFVSRLLQGIQNLKVGDGLKPGTTMGPLINAAAVAHVEALVQDALQNGASCIAGGQPHTLGGNFYEPTMLTGIKPQMRIFREEIFGPVAAVMSFEHEEEAVALANDTEYGLASYVCTRDMARTWRLWKGLQYGMVGVNDAGLASAETPFGGVKGSGMGREGGREGLLEYMETHYALLGGM